MGVKSRTICHLKELQTVVSVFFLLMLSSFFSNVACQPTQPYSFRPSLYQPQQPPLAPPTSASYPTPNPPYMSPNPASAMPPPLYTSQPQASPTSLNPSSSLPPPSAPPPSGGSFQHGRPGAPASSLPYALPPGPTGTETSTSELAPSQKTDLRLKKGCGDVCTSR